MPEKYEEHPMSKNSPLPLIAMIALCAAGVLSSFWPARDPGTPEESRQAPTASNAEVSKPLRAQTPPVAHLTTPPAVEAAPPDPELESQAHREPAIAEVPSDEEAISRVGPVAAVAPLLKVPAPEPEKVVQAQKAVSVAKAPVAATPKAAVTPTTVEPVAVAPKPLPAPLRKEASKDSVVDAPTRVEAPVSKTSAPVQAKPVAEVGRSRAGISAATRAAALAATDDLDDSKEPPVAAPRAEPKSAEVAIPGEYAIVGFDSSKVWLKVDATRTVVIQKGESVPGLGQFRYADSSGAQFDAGKVTRHVDVQPAN
jgi:hypothetical protein